MHPSRPHPRRSRARPRPLRWRRSGPSCASNSTTREKIAWESFGDLTEAIVRQSIERVESIAWEVIPRMAETLIQEEIRRLKADPEED
jgi:hypothetical protein